MFIHSEEKLTSLPLLADTARFFEGQVASTLVVFHIIPFMSNRLLVRTLEKAMLLFYFCMNCKLKFHLYTLSYPFHTSGKLSMAPDRTTFNVREEFRRLVRNNISQYLLSLSPWTDSSVQRSNRLD